MAASMGDSGTVRSRLIALRLVLLVLLFANAVDAKGTATITPAPSRPTTVPIWLPNMSGEEWSQWRGSIISSNDVETVYTIFCPAERPGCTVFSTNDMPVTFTEGPATLRTANTIAGLLSITEACILASTTAATCSGSTWVQLGFSRFLSSISNTTIAPYTLSGTDVDWGVLTLGDGPLTSTRGGREYTYYTTTTTTTTNAAAATATTTTTSNGSPAAATTGTKAGGNGNAGGAGGGGNAAATGKGKPKKSDARMTVGVSEEWKRGVVLVGLVAALLW